MSKIHGETDGRALKQALIAGMNRVISERDQLNRINVFPVPDGDTGSNLGMTLSSVRDALRAMPATSAGAVFERMAREAIDAARGNSGAILAQFLQGLGESLAGHGRLALHHLASAAACSSEQARLAVAEPREGTMLSVISAFADSLRQACDHGVGDIRQGFSQALLASRQALADTPNQLAVLRKAGVVDAGAQGFLHLLEGINAFIVQGRSATRDSEPSVSGEAGVVVALDEPGESAGRWCTECVLSSPDIDRLAVRSALDALGGSSLVMAGTREKLRIHMHLDEPARMFDLLSTFGEVRARKADDMHAQQRAAHDSGPLVVVVDSAADLPAEALESLPLQVVPVRINVGAEDYLDKVSLSAEAFYALLRNGDNVVRTSQPPAADFRRLFGFLLSHHAELLYVGVSRAVSGTLQAGESAASGFGSRIRIVDSANVSGGHGLLALHAAERALAGLRADVIAQEIEALREQTSTFAYLPDLELAVRGGRVPAWALPITRWLGLVPIVRIGGGSGRLHVAGVTLKGEDLATRFVRRVLRRLDRGRDWRALVMHCDDPEQGGRVRDALLEQLPGVECPPQLAAGSAIAAHAGPGAIALSLMPRNPG